MIFRSLLTYFLSTGFILSGLYGVMKPVLAQSRNCYEISDSDGWTNIRNRESGEVIAQIDNGERVLIQGFKKNIAIMAAPHGQFTIHPSRLKPVNERTRCFRFTTIEPEGYLNLRKSPNGRILSRITNGTALVILGPSNTKNWVRVLTEDGKTGFVYFVGFEVYTGQMYSGSSKNNLVFSD